MQVNWQAIVGKRMFKSLLLIAVILILAAPLQALAAGPAEEISSESWNWFPRTSIYALILAVLHLAAPQIRRLLQGREAIVGSFGGGMAAAYVFVHLLPELDKGHVVFGRMIFVVALVSFVVYYGIGKLVHLLSQRRPREGESSYSLYVTSIYFAVYNWLIIYGSPDEFADNGLRAVAIVVAVGLHLLHSDFELGSEHPRTFDNVTRYVLAVAPLVGWLTVIIDQKTNESLNDFLVAVLAGVLMYGIFHEEIPEHQDSRYWWFLTGVAGFVTFTAISI